MAIQLKLGSGKRLLLKDQNKLNKVWKGLIRLRTNTIIGTNGVMKLNRKSELHNKCLLCLHRIENKFLPVHIVTECAEMIEAKENILFKNIQENDKRRLLRMREYKIKLTSFVLEGKVNLPLKRKDKKIIKENSLMFIEDWYLK